MTEKEIIDLEKRVKHIQSVIDNHRNKLSQYENKLLAIAQQLTQIKNKQSNNQKKIWK